MHPYHDIRQTKVERSRVGKILGAGEGAQIAQAAAKRHEAMTNPGSGLGSSPIPLKRGGMAGGAKASHRLDRPARARGGRVKAPVEVNVVIAKDKSQMPGLPQGGMPPMPPPQLPAPALAGPPPAGAGLPPGGPPMMRAKGGRVRRADGGKTSVEDVGRASSRLRDKSGRSLDEGDPNDPPANVRAGGFARGGAVKNRGKTAVKAEGDRNGTPVQPSPGQNDISFISKTPPITRKKGGRVFPHMTAGAGSGEGRIQKEEAYGAKQRKG